MAAVLIAFISPLPGAEAASADPSAPRLNKDVRVVTSESFASLKLRGYGTVSGEFLTVAAPSGKASLLQIHCGDEASARLLCAKYLSDAALLPSVAGIRVPIAGGQVAALEAAGQGCLSAGRTGANVSIFAAGNAVDLAWLIARTPGLDKAVWTPETQAPMWLDRWDKHGFRFYYRPWERPPNEKWDTYDVTQEFAYAKEHGDSGFTFWASPNMCDTAEGMTQDSYWDWAQTWAKAKGLTVGINLNAENILSTPKWIYDRYRDRLATKAPQFTGGFHSLSDDGSSIGMMPWGITEPDEALLGVMQTIMRRFSSEPNVVKWLEPHAEMLHNVHDPLLDYGPASDATYREYLRGRYPTPAALGKAWFGDAHRLKSWDDARVPELAEFLGWGPGAMDLSGVWKVKHLDDGSPIAETLFAANLDDRAWPDVKAPGNDRSFFLPKKYAVYAPARKTKSNWSPPPKSRTAAISFPSALIFIRRIDNGFAPLRLA